MNWSMVRYKVKADRVAENEEYIRKVFEQLRQSPLPGFTYTSFKLADGVSFIAIVGVEGATSPLVETPAFREFAAGIGDRCDELPVTTPISAVGTYAWIGEGIS